MGYCIDAIDFQLGAVTRCHDRKNAPSLRTVLSGEFERLSIAPYFRPLPAVAVYQLFDAFPYPLVRDDDESLGWRELGIVEDCDAEIGVDYAHAMQRSKLAACAVGAGQSDDPVLRFIGEVYN